MGGERLRGHIFYLIVSYLADITSIISLEVSTDLKLMDRCKDF